MAITTHNSYSNSWINRERKIDKPAAEKAGKNNEKPQYWNPPAFLVLTKYFLNYTRLDNKVSSFQFGTFSWKSGKNYDFIQNSAEKSKYRA